MIGCRLSSLTVIFWFQARLQFVALEWAVGTLLLCRKAVIKFSNEVSDIKISIKSTKQRLIRQHWDIIEIFLFLIILGVSASLFALIVWIEFFYYYFALFSFSRGNKMGGWCSSSLFLKSYCQILLPKRHTQQQMNLVPLQLSLISRIAALFGAQSEQQFAGRVRSQELCRTSLSAWLQFCLALAFYSLNSQVLNDKYFSLSFSVRFSRAVIQSIFR